jgi:hypothetical protein
MWYHVVLADEIVLPDVLGDPTTVGHVESDLKSGMIDYIIDIRESTLHQIWAGPSSRSLGDASFLRPTFSPFESLFHSLIPASTPRWDPLTPGPIPSLVPISNPDELDIVVDHSTLLHIINFLRDPSEQVCRTDCEFTSSQGAVMMHHWLPKVMYGAGEPRRGYVQSYTRRLTAPLREGGWNGGTTQIVRYNLGGIGMLVRYPVQAMVGGQPTIGEVKEYTFNTKTKEVSKTVLIKSDSGTNTNLNTNTNTNVKTPTYPDVDRDQSMAIKVLNTNPKTKTFDLDDLYVRLVLTQSEKCLIAPHYRGDFNYPDHPSQVVSIHDPLFDEVRDEVELLLKQAIGVWRSMVNITRKLGRNVSFVGNEDGSIQVLGMKKGPYEHVGLIEMALGMLAAAARELISTRLWL